MTTAILLSAAAGAALGAILCALYEFSAHPPEDY